MDREPPCPTTDDPGEAARRIACALSRSSDDPRDALEALIGEGPRTDAAAVAHRLVRAAPREPGPWVLLGSVAATQRLPQAARLCWQRALACDPSHVEARVLLGSALWAAGELSGARAHLDAALELDPHNPGAIASVARLLLRQGAHREAWELIQGGRPSSDPRLALAAAEAAGAAGAAEVAGAGQAATALDAVDAALATAPSPPTCVRLLAARGELCDALGRHTEAFAAWTESNRRALAEGPGEADGVARILEAITGLDWGAIPSRTPSRPVALVGLPHSGLSLLERSLSQHPAIRTASVPGSLGLLAEAVLRPRDACWTAVLPRLRGSILDPLRMGYLDALGSSRGERILDRWWGNLRYLGLLARILPGARVIVCTRAPLDVGLSCFRRGGGSGLTWSMSLEGIGQHLVESQRLLEHWRRHLPLRFHTVRYEGLVSDPAQVLRGVVAFLGLPWDPAVVLSTDEVIRDPRTLEVLPPLHARSVARAAPYAAALAPLAARLEMDGVRRRSSRT
ncbi:MAG TPA: sulfotransferase family protein [Deltaproteobacteria bacterium]|nr:sulfotransferase family protein [Deltaproteobacteria bacterium]